MNFNDYVKLNGFLIAYTTLIEIFCTLIKINVETY